MSTGQSNETVSELHFKVSATWTLPDRMGFYIETDAAGVHDRRVTDLVRSCLIEVELILCQRFTTHRAFALKLKQLPGSRPLSVFMRSLRSPSVVHLFQKADVGQHATKASDSLQVLALLQNEADTSTAFRIGVEPWGIPNDCGGRARPTWFRDFCAPRPISPVFFLLNDSPISTSSCFMVELGAMRGLIRLYLIQTSMFATQVYSQQIREVELLASR